MTENDIQRFYELPVTEAFRGEPGPPGPPFNVDKSGPLANRDDFLADDTVQSYLADDTGDLYIKREDGAWGPPIAFRGPAGDPGTPGQDGDDGRSAFQIAQDEGGYAGTLQQWLDSLKGAPGDNGATIHHTIGPPDPNLGEPRDWAIDVTNDTYYGPKSDTEGEDGFWGAGRSLTGDTGPPGDDAFAVAVDAGFSGTRQEWLESLSGADGADGEDGLSWQPDATGALAERSVWDAQLKDFAYFAHDTGSLYVKASDTSGDWSAAIPYEGPRGERGEIGPAGRDGEPGPDFFAVRALITSSVTQAGIPDPSVTDNVTLQAGDYVLDVGNTNAARRGPWTVRSGGWARPQSWSTRARHIMVTEGSLHADREYKLTTPDPITLGTTQLSFMRSDVGRAEAYTDQRIAALQRVQPNFLYGLNMTWVSPTKVTVSPGSAWVPGLSDVLTLDSLTTLTPGLYGLPASLSPNTLYFCFLTNSGPGTAARIACFSGAAFAPVPYSEGAKVSAGNNSRRYLGSVLSNAAGTGFVKTIRTGPPENREVRYPVSLADTTHSLRVVSLRWDLTPAVGARNTVTTPVPPYCEGMIAHIATATGMALSVDYNTPNETKVDGYQYIDPDTRRTNELTLMLDPESRFVYIVNTAGTAGSLFINVLGYRERLT